MVLSYCQFRTMASAYLPRRCRVSLTGFFAQMPHVETGSPSEADWGFRSRNGSSKRTAAAYTPVQSSTAEARFQFLSPRLKRPSQTMGRTSRRLSPREPIQTDGDDWQPDK